MDPQDEAVAVDVFGVDGEGFEEAQAAVVDEGEEGAVATVVEGVEEDADVLRADDVGERLVTLGFDFIPDVPVPTEMGSEEAFEGLLGLVDGGASKLADVLAMDDEILHLPRRQIRDAEAGIMLAELTDPSGIGFDGFGVQSGKLDKAQVVLIPIF